jgi:hypothetical protein
MRRPDDDAFDDLARAFGSATTRRGSLKLLLTGIVSAGVGAGLAQNSGAGVAASAARGPNRVKTLAIVTGSCDISTSADASCEAVRSFGQLGSCESLQQGSPGDFNGCGSQGFHSEGHLAGGVDVTPCCNAHDCCYSTCNAAKGDCDTAFLTCMHQLCNEGSSPRICRAEAGVFYDLVRTSIGDTAYVEAQVAGCLCCCSDGKTRCHHDCVDLNTDPRDCGACGNVCEAGQQCVQGACTCDGIICPTGTTCCNKQCVDFSTDPDNCGSCGHACAAGDFCVAGECLSCLGVNCAAGQACCSGACVDLQTDSAHCGTCGNVCAADLSCVNGICQGNCGLQNCTSPATCCTANGFSVCTDLSDDPNNCGACGNVCQGSATCQGSGICCAGILYDGDQCCEGPANFCTLNGISVCCDVGVPCCDGGPGGGPVCGGC